MRTTPQGRSMISLSPSSAPRLRLRSPNVPGSPRAVLDGAWWPHSADPATELPALILALQALGPPDDQRPITHLMLRSDDWDGHPDRLRLEASGNTRAVRLSWFDSLTKGLLIAIYADGRRIDLLTVPPRTHHAAAQAAMELAAHPSNRLHVADLLAALATPVDSGHQPGVQAESENAWESEGGRLREHLSAD